MTRPLLVLLTCLFVGASAWGAGWEEKPLPVKGQPGDQFGASLAVGKGVIAVGAYLSDEGGKDSGSVYLFKREPGPGGNWASFGPRLDGAPGEWFGFDLAINAAGTVLIVGAPNPGKGAGAVFAVDIDSVKGTAVRRSEALLQGEQKGDELGSSVAIDGTQVAAGARGADRRAGRVYVLDQPERQPKTIVSPNSKAGREFGQSVSLSKSFLVVGEPFPGEDRRSPGTAYFFNLGLNGNWIELKPSPELAPGSAYGYSIAIRSGRVLVGAPLADSQAGAVFSFDCETVCPQRTLKFEAERGDQLGVAVALSETTAVVGARGAREKAGHAFVLGSDSTSLETWLPRPSIKGDEFGFAAAIHEEDVIAVGAFREGAAYVFEPKRDVPPTQKITLSLSPVAQEVGEGETAFVDVVVTTTDGLPPAKTFDMTVSTKNGSASAPEDYVKISVIPELGENNKYLPVQIPTVDDSALEADEKFQVVISSTTAGVNLPDSPTDITILDDDCAQLSFSSLSVDEGGPTASFNVHLSQAPTSAVTLSFTSTNPGVMVGPSVTFSAGEQDQTVDVSTDIAICKEEPLSFTATVTADSADPDFACIQEERTVNLTDDIPCIEILSSVCTEGGAVLYTWKIANHGNLPLAGASGPEISKVLPKELTVVAASADRGVATVDYVENETVWNGSIPAGSSAIIETLAALEPDVDLGTDLGFEATYSYTGGETTFEVPFVVGEAAICPPPPPE